MSERKDSIERLHEINAMFNDDNLMLDMISLKDIREIIEEAAHAVVLRWYDDFELLVKDRPHISTPRTMEDLCRRSDLQAAFKYGTENAADWMKDTIDSMLTEKMSVNEIKMFREEKSEKEKGKEPD